MKNTKQIRTLEELGLSENEALLYSICLKHPRSTVQELGTRSPFPRTMLYHVLNQLTARGLVTTSKDKWRTVFIAENPGKLYDLLSKKEKEFERSAHAIKSLIPELRNSYRLADKRPHVRIFEGIEEYKKALEDVIISLPEVVLVYENPIKKNPGLEIRALHENKRITRKISKKILFPRNEKTKEKVSKQAYNDFTEWRSLPPKNLEVFEVDFMLYDGKILYTSYDEREPTAILIEDRALYAMQKSLFLSLWQEGKDETLEVFKNKK